MRKEIIGHVGVDSGNLILIDPCYIKHIDDLHEDKNWQSFCENVLFPMHKGKINATEIESGVVFGNAIGDGKFPVTATLDNDGRITKIEVSFK